MTNSAGGPERGWRYVYVKRWRTLIHVPESIADEVRDALSPAPSAPHSQASEVVEALELADDVLRNVIKTYGPSPLIDLTRKRIAAALSRQAQPADMPSGEDTWAELEKLIREIDPTLPDDLSDREVRVIINREFNAVECYPLGAAPEDYNRTQRPDGTWASDELHGAPSKWAAGYAAGKASLQAELEWYREEVARLTAGAMPSGEWQDISTAKLDGTFYLLARERRVTFGCWTVTPPLQWASYDGGFTKAKPPTHCIPAPVQGWLKLRDWLIAHGLPAAPTAQAKADIADHGDSVSSQERHK